MEKERVAVFIDGSNLYHSLKRLGILKSFRFEKLINELVRDRDLVAIHYYIAVLDFKTNPGVYWKQQKFLEELRKLPKFSVVLCTLRKLRRKHSMPEFVLKRDDIHLANDLLVGAYEDRYDTAIIVSGDEDFVPVIESTRKLGKRVGNAYFKSSSSEALRRSCDFSIPLDKTISKMTI